MVVFFGCAGTWLWPVGFSGWSGLASVVAAHGLSCSAACGILVPWGGIEPLISVLEGGLLTTGPWRNCQIVVVLPAHWLSVQEGGWKKGEGKYLLGTGISRAVSLWAEALFVGHPEGPGRHTLRWLHQPLQVGWYRQCAQWFTETCHENFSPLLENSMDRPWGCKELDTPERLTLSLSPPQEESRLLPERDGHSKTRTSWNLAACLWWARTNSLTWTVIEDF